MKFSVFLALAGALILVASSAHAQKWTKVYAHSGPLANYQLTLESNPGVNGPYPTTPNMSDVSMKSVTADGRACTAVTANVKPRNVYVNALAFDKFSEKTPDGQPIGLKTYRYVFDVRLAHVPTPNRVLYNAQSVEMSLQFWDGSNALWAANKRQVEATIYWNLNPWDKSFGEILVYTNSPNGGLTLHDTGIHLTPDTKWHRFELTADLERKVWDGITIDSQHSSLTGLPLLLRSHPDWGSGVFLALTAESMNCYPGPDASYVNQWTTDFADAELYREE